MKVPQKMVDTKAAGEPVLTREEALAIMEKQRVIDEKLDMILAHLNIQAPES